MVPPSAQAQMAAPNPEIPVGPLPSAGWALTSWRGAGREGANGCSAIICNPELTVQGPVLGAGQAPLAFLSCSPQLREAELKVEGLVQGMHGAQCWPRAASRPSPGRSRLPDLAPSLAQGGRCSLNWVAWKGEAKRESR